MRHVDRPSNVLAIPEFIGLKSSSLLLKIELLRLEKSLLHIAQASRPSRPSVILWLPR